MIARQVARRHRAIGSLIVIELLGDDILMYASDYPPGESWFPKSVDTCVVPTTSTAPSRR